MKPGGRITRTTLSVDAENAATSTAFYRDVMGFTVVSEDGTGSILERDNVQLYVSIPRAPFPNQKPPEIKRTFIHLEVSDLAGFLEHVRSFSGIYNMGRLKIKKYGGLTINDPTGNGIFFDQTEGRSTSNPEDWRDPLNRDELVTVSQLPGSIGCNRRYVWRMIRAGYRLQYRALRRTTPRHALEGAKAGL